MYLHKVVAQTVGRQLVGHEDPGSILDAVHHRTILATLVDYQEHR